MAIAATDATQADRADLARLREALAAQLGEDVGATAAETAACLRPPHHAELFAREEMCGRGGTFRDEEAP